MATISAQASVKRGPVWLRVLLLLQTVSGPTSGLLHDGFGDFDTFDRSWPLEGLSEREGHHDSSTRLCRLGRLGLVKRSPPPISSTTLSDMVGG